MIDIRCSSSVKWLIVSFFAKSDYVVVSFSPKQEMVMTTSVFHMYTYTFPLNSECSWKISSKKFLIFFGWKLVYMRAKTFAFYCISLFRLFETSCSWNEFICSQKIKITEYIIFIFRHYIAETQVTHRYFFNFEQVYLENG